MIPCWLGRDLSLRLRLWACFTLTHRALGRNWSISLDLRENHALVTEAIYWRVRHPMYSAFWLWLSLRHFCCPTGLPVSRDWSGSASCVLVA
ncbi:isoprenylcysteine carboxylmethyltransferase family protein [Bradyrhizobium sp. S3.5.5]|uniref:isoprenylcysteine carboxylmethyltransferase family protein n=1 Tax=Bradyrhizobium sp. S3.5.5 TaxID=3156430 RepID=UPI003399E930